MAPGSCRTDLATSTLKCVAGTTSGSQNVGWRWRRLASITPLLPGKHKIEIEGEPWAFECTSVRRPTPAVFPVVADQRALHTENGVGIEILVAAREHMSDQPAQA